MPLPTASTSGQRLPTPDRCLGRQTRPTRHSRLLLLIFAALLHLHAGCQEFVESPSQQHTSVAAQADAQPESPGGAQPAAADANPSPPKTVSDEQWMACYIQQRQVGYMHLVTEAVMVDGQPRRRYRYQDSLTMQRFDNTTAVSTRLETLETTGGSLLSFRSEVMAGPSAMVTQGEQRDGQMRLSVQTQGRKEQHAIAWQEDWGGFFADQQTLLDKPLKPGQSRRLKALLPVVHQLGDIQLKAIGYEATPLLEGSRQLLRIEVTTELGPTRLRAIVWTDERGQVWKSQDLQVNLVAYRTSREEAMRPTSGGGFDLGSDTIVRVDRPLPQPRLTTEAVYRARLGDAEAAEAADPADDAIARLFVQDAAQSVKLLGAQAAEITVRAIRPTQPEKLAEAATGPGEAERSPGSLIQSDDPLIREMASAAAGDDADPWSVACRLERFVKSTVQLKNYSTAMATAAEVARSREGDCTEHAMLLAALCRARGIPARVALGLVYYPPAQGFAYHMWTEVWIEDRWIGLDATLGDGGIGADHLKLIVSALQGAHAYADLLPIVHAIGHLKLEVLQVKH